MPALKRQTHLFAPKTRTSSEFRVDKGWEVSQVTLYTIVVLMQQAKSTLPVACSTRQQLAMQLATAARLYAEAVALLTSRAGIISQEEYDGLSDNAQQRRGHTELARIEFEAHVESHRCATTTLS
jgi:hypothetical protein